ncbi:MAG: hypothetical protein MK212_11905 [Saprospiraceae bacterium]|nr:hypothetical protein [Saprospiraceae bacterium]
MNIKFGQLKLWQAALFFVAIIVALAFIGNMVEKKAQKKQTVVKQPQPNIPNSNAGSEGEQAPKETVEQTTRRAY